MFNNGFDRWKTFLQKTASILAGSIFFAIGVVAMLNAELGMNTWAVLDVGIQNHTNLSLGTVSQLTGFMTLGIG